MVILCRCGKLGMQSGEVGNKTPQHWEGPVFICDKPTHAKDTDYTTIFIWVFPTIGVPKNGWWKIMENPIKMDDCRGTLFLEAPNIYIYIHIYIYTTISIQESYTSRLTLRFHEAIVRLGLLASNCYSRAFARLGEISWGFQKAEWISTSMMWRLSPL